MEITIPMIRQRWNCPIPSLVPMRQRFDDPIVDNPRQTAFTSLCNGLDEIDSNFNGGKVAIAVGSRGIAHIADIVAGVVDATLQAGGKPVIVPAMGSHGGDRAEVKADILAGLGVTEARVGAPVSQTAECSLVGNAKDDLPVYCQAEARSARAIILINRIKPHTDFRGEIESGLIKLAGIGLGGSRGASAIHARGYDHLGARVRAAGELALKLLPIRLGLAIIEGRNGHPNHIEAIPAPRIPLREKELLVRARNLVPMLPVKKMDVLVVAEIGKDISGAGLDPAVIGRHTSGKCFAGVEDPEFYRISALDLTEASAGNAVGIGMCDVTTRTVLDKTDFTLMYQNIITGKGSISARFPMVMGSDREAICVALLTCTKDPTNANMALIRNTLKLQNILVSESLVAKCEMAGAEVTGKSLALAFDNAGSLIWPDCLDYS